MGQMKKLWEQDIENAQCQAEDVIALMYFLSLLLM